MLTITQAPKDISAFTVDRDGTLWFKAKSGVYKRESPADAWQRTWEVVAHMPGGSHDLSGDVLDGNFYMMWAITGDFGYPSTGAFHRHLLGFDAKASAWRKVSDYGLPRGYGGTGALDGKIWSVGGDAIVEEKRVTVPLAQIIDPATGAVEKGPDLPALLPAAICLSAGGRLYTLGFARSGKVKKGEPPKKNFLKLFSIGKGETAWTEEPQGPEGNGSSYGVEMDGKLYTVVDHRYLAIFDTAAKNWETTEAPNSPRSPALGHYKGEIWVMGGRNKDGGKATVIYSPAAKEWRKGPSLPWEINWGCAFTIGGRLYVTGGAASNPYRFHSRTFRLQER
jgi:hypothetical protein